MVANKSYIVDINQKIRQFLQRALGIPVVEFNAQVAVLLGADEILRVAKSVIAKFCELHAEYQEICQILIRARNFAMGKPGAPKVYILGDQTTAELVKKAAAQLEAWNDNALRLKTLVNVGI